MKKHYLTLFLASIILTTLACVSTSTPNTQPTEQASNGLPDLIISQGVVHMQGYAGGCVENYSELVSSICVQNVGNAPAGSFILQAGDAAKMTIPSLPPGETSCFDMQGNLSNTTISVDALNTIAESNENNNTFTIPNPTAPPLCTTTSSNQSESNTALPPTTEAQPTNTPQPTDTPQPTSVPDTRHHVNFNGIQFSADESLASLISPSVFPADTEDFPWALPEHTEFLFIDYPLPDTFHEPHILVIPINELVAMNSGAANTIAELGNMLINQPQHPDEIPFLPVFNAAQFMQAQVRYFDFQNGKGLRFVTQYGQAANPINNKEMFYTYQGLTNDKKYYLSAILPVSHPYLPDPSTVTMDDAFYNYFQTYVGQIESELNDRPADSFYPSLEILDAMMQSFLITAP
ncbi:MAG: hypothetical protein J7L73_08555 [Anaerolineales bacterium]|nr:hypothetical protein [Anaerolineales bacterium]